MREEESSLTTEAKLDPLIAPYVKLLNIHSINTEWSCQGHLHEKYPTGFPKPKTARISGFLRHLSDLLKIEELLVGEGCHCGTCKHFRITEAGAVNFSLCAFEAFRIDVKKSPIKS